MRLVREADAGPVAQSIEIGLVRELDQACAEIARRKRLSSPAASATAKAAEKAFEELQTAPGASLLQARADRLAAENERLSHNVTERARALDDARALIESLKEKLSAAAGEGAARRPEGQPNELRAPSDRLPRLDAATGENARLLRVAAERERAFADARTRVEYLEAALAAAEVECGRMTEAAAAARERHQAEIAALKARFDEVSSRAATAEKLLAEARERLLARIIETDAVRQRVADAHALSSAAYDRQRRLEDELSLQQGRFEELERSQSKLAEAAKTLLQRFRDRDRALLAAEQRIKALAARNAQLEAGGDHAGGSRRSGGDSRPAPADTDDMARQDWAELARLVTEFMERKASIAQPAKARSAA